MRVLVAEDEMDMNNILNMKLTDAGYSVDSCFDGEEAIFYCKSAEYDLIILDINMPKADGFAVLDHLRRSGQKTPVLFLTARDSITDRVRGLDAGANDYLVKPFSLEELMARVRVLTRSAHGSIDNVLTAADLTLNLFARQLAIQYAEMENQPVKVSIACCIGMSGVNYSVDNPCGENIASGVMNVIPSDLIERYCLNKPIFTSMCMFGLFGEYQQYKPWEQWHIDG